MRHFLSALMIGSVLALGACSKDPAGPTYPIVGTVSQTDMKKTADAARLTYFGILNIAAEYASLPRCVSGAAVSVACSSQTVVAEMRRYSEGADIATSGMQRIANSPTTTPVSWANALADGQRAIEVFRHVVAVVRPAAKEVK